MLHKVAQVPKGRDQWHIKHPNLISNSISPENVLHEKHSIYSLHFEFYALG